jgi:hypothetical protein
MSTMMNEAQEIILIRLINDIIFASENLFIRSNFATEKEIIDPLIPYIRDANTPALRVYAIEAIKTLGFKAPYWINELLSIFLSFTTITNADLTNLKYTPIYIL